MSAPHLPPKSCNIEAHRRRQTIPWFISVVLLAMVAGGSAAIMAVAWLVPTFLQDTSTYVRNRANQEAGLGGEMDTLLARQLEQRTVTLFDKRKLVGNAFYADTAKIGTLAVLSSDGWSVMYEPNYQTGQEQFWQVSDDKGSLLPIEKVSYDKESYLLYVKLAGNGFQVFSFMEWRDIEPGMLAWFSVDSRWQKKMFTYPRAVVLDGAINPEQIVWEYFAPIDHVQKSLVLTEQGQLVGFVSKEGSIVPGYRVMAALPYILTTGTISRSGLLLTGYHIAHQVNGSNLAPVPGFYIASIQSSQLKKKLQVGDIITRINGEQVTPQLFSELLLISSDTVLFDILRKGIVVSNIEVKKEIVL